MTTSQKLMHTAFKFCILAPDSLPFHRWGIVYAWKESDHFLTG